MRVTVLFSALVVVVNSLPTDLPEPGQLALVLNEDDFEDYLDTWLEIEGRKRENILRSSSRSTGCSIRVNGDLGQPQPVYLKGDHYLVPNGNTGFIQLNTREQVYIACTGSNRLLQHPNISSSTATGTATCVNSTLVTGAGWLNGNGEFGQITCSSHSNHDAQATTERCYNNNIVIRVGFTVDGVFYPLYWSCFDQYRLEVLYVWYEQNPPNSVHQANVDRPSWLAGSFYPGVAVNTIYTQVQQKLAIAKQVGADLADKYVTSTQFLARGHLAAKTDFIYATGQRATFYFINAAPQWQPFNAGNWNWLEQQLQTSLSKSAVAEHSEEGSKHYLRFDKPQILAKEHRFLPRMIREDIEIKKHPNFNREDGWKLAPAWDPIIHLIKSEPKRPTARPQDTNLRKRIGEAGYNTVVYTGTFGVTQLRNQNDQLVDIYLYYDANNNPQIPVPLYYYKVVYDSSLRLGTAFVSINNPYYNATEVRSLQFCTDRCRNNNSFSWIGWQPDRIDLGYSFCCTVDDFRRVIPHLPSFTVNGLLS